MKPEKKRFDAYSTTKILFMPMGALLGRKEVVREVVEPRVIDLYKFFASEHNTRTYSSKNMKSVEVKFISLTKRKE